MRRQVFTEADETGLAELYASAADELKAPRELVGKIKTMDEGTKKAGRTFGRIRTAAAVMAVLVVLVLGSNLITYAAKGTGWIGRLFSSLEPEEQPAITVYPAEYPATRTVTWMFDYFSEKYFSELNRETAKEINRILYEKGLDCQIVFVNIGLTENTGLLEKQVAGYEREMAATYGHLDIINIGGEGFYTPLSVKNGFAERYLVPLDDWLASEEGRTLREFYTADEWKQVTRNGKIYVVPRAAFQTGFDAKGQEVFDAVGYGNGVSVNEKYESYFADFDGTYASLKKIYESIGDPNLYIGIDYCFDEAEVYSLLGYSTLRMAGYLPYDEKNERIVNLLNTDEVPALLKELYGDLRTGLLVDMSETKEVPGEMLAYIHGRDVAPRKGTLEYPMAGNKYEYNINGKYGISATSTQKELAMQILTVCMTDPEILKLLYPGLTEDLIAKRTEILSLHPASELAGISMDSVKEKLCATGDWEENYDLRFSRLISEMFIRRQDNSRTLNAQWNVEEAWQKYAKEEAFAAFYAELCEIANDEVRKWLNK